MFLSNLIKLFSKALRMVDMSTFSRIKSLANEKKVSLQEVAKAAGIGENSIYAWRTKAPSSDKLQLVADYFNVSTDYLLERTDNPFLENEIPEWATKTDVLELEKFLTSNKEMRYDGVKLTKEDEAKLKGFLEGLFWERLETHRKRNQ